MNAEQSVLGDVETKNSAKSKLSSPKDRVLIYFALVFGLSIPFWLISALLGNRLSLPINLPISALAFVTPLIAALILSYKDCGWDGILDLLKRSFDYERIQIRVWYLPIIVSLPLINLLSYTIMRLTGLPLPAPTLFPVYLAPVFFVVFFIGAACEELGWSGYAIDRLEERWGALKGSLVLGLVWSLMHIIGDIHAGHAAAWILWQRLFTIALRILIVWIYINTGKSVFATILVHTMDNVSAFMFPNYGSHYNPFLNGLITWLLVGILLLVWRARTMTDRQRELRSDVQ